MNEVIESGPKTFIHSAYLKQCEEVPFVKGDSVCIVDIELAPYGNADALDKLVPKERRISTMFENVNRRGEITEIKFKFIKMNSGKGNFKSVRIKVRFPGDFFVEIGNHEFIRRVN